MPRKPTTQEQLLAENEVLRARLEKLEETIREILSGEADALFVSGAGGEQVFTLKGADHTFRVLIEEMNEGALTLTAEGMILYANRSFAEMLKTPLEKLIGSTIHTWIAPDSQRILHSLLIKGADEKRRDQLVLTASDGTLVHVSLSVNNLLVNEMLNYFCLVATDLTEQKRSDAIAASEKLAQELLAASNQARCELMSVIEDQKQTEERLQKSEGSLAEAQHIAGIGNWETDIQKNTLTWSDEIYRIFGYKPQEFEASTEFFLNSVHPDDRELVVQSSEEALNEMKPYNIDHRIVLPDGTQRFVHEQAKIITDETGKPVRLLGTVQDTTDRMKSEEEKSWIEEQSRQAQKVESIGRLAGGVAHDLNNLLTPILGYSEMLLKDFDPSDTRREPMNEILQAGFRARDLVRQLLAFSRKQTMEYKQVDMNQAVTLFEKLLRRTIREDIEIEIIPSPDIPPVMADIGQIEQVIMNLAVNAQDAMTEGGHLTIEIATAELDEKYAATKQDVEPGEYIRLAVSDTGCGMDEETREHMFEPFFSTKGELGTGLGLSTVYGIVKQHGGNIWVYSEPGMGTTFKIYLPVSREAQVEEKFREKAATAQKGSETILLVEDNEQVRHLTHTILKRQGYTVLVAESGPKALTILAAHNGPVDLLLTDVIMPGMNGRDLFAKVSEQQPGIKVLYMSGYTDNVITEHGVQNEDVAFIQKPFTIQALAAKVREVLDQ